MHAIGFFYHIREKDRAISHNFYSENERKTFLRKRPMKEKRESKAGKRPRETEIKETDRDRLTDEEDSALFQPLFRHILVVESSHEDSVTLLCVKGSVD